MRLAGDLYYRLRVFLTFKGRFLGSRYRGANEKLRARGEIFKYDGAIPLGVYILFHLADDSTPLEFLEARCDIHCGGLRNRIAVGQARERVDGLGG